MKNVLVTGLVIAVLAAGAVGLFAAFGKSGQPSGAVSGDRVDFTLSFGQNFTNSGVVSTTTVGSATVTAVELAGWLKQSMVSINQGLMAGTVTLPASSTISHLVPRSGDRQSFCMRNATTTSGVLMTIAGGTGTNLLVASSSGSVLGGTKLLTDKVGCLTFIRQPDTDIDVLLTVFQ